MNNLFTRLMLVSLLALSVSSCVSSDAYGPISLARLQSDFPHFQSHPVTTADAQALQNTWRKHSQLKVKIFFATWCHDSERELPRLLGLLSAASVDLIALDRHKHDPENQVQHFSVQRTPTMIILQAEQELGRIVERPQQSVFDDVMAILARAQ